MLGWLKDKIVKASAERQVKSDVGDSMTVIKKHGGADRIVMAYLDYFAKNEERMARFRCGRLKPEEYPMDRMLIATAAINSIMAARRDLRNSPGDEHADARLKVAEQAFLLSWLHLEVSDIEHITEEEIKVAIDKSFHILMETQDFKKAYAVFPHRNVADERMRLAHEALAKWREANIDTFPFNVPI